MLKLQPDTKPIKTKIAGESLFRGFIVVSLVLKLAALDATFNFGIVFIFVKSHYRLRIKYYNWLKYYCQYQ
jgi:hypothetical protein